jgi:hypothetical protein
MPRSIAFLDDSPEGAVLVCDLHVTAEGPGERLRAIAEGAAHAGGDAVCGFRAGPAPYLGSAEAGPLSCAPGKFLFTAKRNRDATPKTRPEKTKTPRDLTAHRSHPRTPAWPRDDARGHDGGRRAATMIELTCWCCGFDGRVREDFAGLRVTCKWCGATSAVPQPATREVYVADWLAATDAGRADPEAESLTVEVECLPRGLTARRSRPR